MTTETAPAHRPPDQNDVEHDAAVNVDAHMPPSPGRQPVWADVWNPDTNEWAPSNEQHSTWGVAEPTHFDAPTATPETPSYGVPDGGVMPDGRLNLLDSVKAGGSPATVPRAVVHHVIETQEEASSHIRTRIVRVQGTAPTTILEQNPNRDRAIVKAITTNGIVVLFPVHQGGVQASAAVPAGGAAGWPLATGDSDLKVESSDGVEAVVFNSGAQAFCDVAIWEEMKGPNDAPGLSG